MRKAKVQNVTHEELGRRFTTSTRVNVSIVDGEDGTKKGGLEWLKSNGFGDLVVETANAMTLAALAKDLLENQGMELPTELFKTSLMTFTSVTKAAERASPVTNKEALASSIKARAAKARTKISPSASPLSEPESAPSSRSKLKSNSREKNGPPAAPPSKRVTQKASPSSGGKRTRGHAK
jgi:hypothetical protein